MELSKKQNSLKRKIKTMKKNKNINIENKNKLDKKFLMQLF